jgi:hypothetical protein
MRHQSSLISLVLLSILLYDAQSSVILQPWHSLGPCCVDCFYSASCPYVYLPYKKLVVKELIVVRERFQVYTGPIVLVVEEFTVV